MDDKLKQVITICTECRGKKQITFLQPCPKCKGTGKRKILGITHDCGHCIGVGKAVVKQTCPVCNGKGYKIIST